jgi:predicted alpha/beta superfamily hydrolase
MIDPATSFSGVPWGVDRAAKRLIKKRAIKEFIAVGIYNSPDRFTEYSGGPRGKNYAKFLVKKLKPFIDKTYRTLPDRNNTVNLGASMGGLISFLISWWHPNVFSSAACFSSAFLWKRNSIIKEVKAKPKKNIRIYTDCGTKNLERILLPGYRQMVTALEKKGFKKGVDLEYFFDKDGDHTEIDWSRRLWRPLKFFFNHRVNMTPMKGPKRNNENGFA